MGKESCQIMKKLWPKVVEKWWIYFHAYHWLDSNMSQIMESICKTCGNDCKITSKKRTYLRWLSTLSDDWVHWPYWDTIVNRFINKLSLKIDMSASL